MPSAWFTLVASVNTKSHLQPLRLPQSLNKNLPTRSTQLTMLVTHAQSAIDLVVVTYTLYRMLNVKLYRCRDVLILLEFVDTQDDGMIFDVLWLIPHRCNYTLYHTVIIFRVITEKRDSALPKIWWWLTSYRKVSRHQWPRRSIITWWPGCSTLFQAEENLTTKWLREYRISPLPPLHNLHYVL